MNKDAEFSEQGLLKNTRFDDTYASHVTPDKEKNYVFCEGNDLKQRFQQVKTFTIAELGFGTGLSFFQCAQLWLQNSISDAKLHFISIEKYPLSTEQIALALNQYSHFDSLKNELLDNYPPILNGFHSISLAYERITLTLIIADIEYALSELNGPINAWFLDGFTPARNEAMWSSTVFSAMATLSTTHSTFATYTASSMVRKGLKAQGFSVEKIKGFGKKRDMLRGRLIEKKTSKPHKPWLNITSSHISKKTIVIVGAGIAGITCAHRLASRGCHVKLIDSADRIATQASANPYAIFSPYLSSSLDNMHTSWLQQGSLYAQRFIKKYAQHDQAKGIIRCGKRFDFTPEKKHTLLAPLNPTFASYLTAQQLKDTYSLDTTNAGIFFPDASHVDIPHLCQSLLADYPSNIEFTPEHTVTSLHKENNSWHVVCNQQTITSDLVILTNASSWPSLTITNHLPIQNVKGQYTVLNINHGLSSMFTNDIGIIPIDDKHLAIGASYIDKNEGDDSTLTTEYQHESNINKLFKAMPRLPQQYRIQSHWKGTRISTPDRLPHIGELIDPEYFHHYFASAIAGGRLPTKPYTNPLAGLHVMGALGSNGLSNVFLGAEVLISQLHHEPLPIPKCLARAVNPNRYLARKIARLAPASKS